MMYSLLERHADGSLWYHPGHTFATPEEVEADFKRTFWWDLDRPHLVFEHDKPLFQEYSTCTKDGGKTFHFAGEIKWEQNPNTERR